MAYCSAKISISSGVFSCGRNRVRGGQARGTTQVAAVGGFVHVGRDDVLSLPSNLKISASDRLLTQYELTRLDSRPDDIYYSLRGTPSDVDPAFKQRLTEAYRAILRPGSKVLDICTGSQSYVDKKALGLDSLVGHGSQEAELARNKELDSFFTKDLNRDPTFPLETGSMDAILITSGMAYLTKPLEVLAECRRVLKPGGTIVLSFGMRCNIERATAGWMTRDLAARVQLVADYLDCAGFSNLDSIGHALDRGCSCCPTDSIGGDIFWGRCPNQVRRSPSDGNAIVVAHAAGDHDASSLAREVEAQRDGLHAVGGPANVVLGEIELWSPSGVSADTLERWARSYEALCSEARSLGIPDHAIPALERPLNYQGVKEARDLLAGIIASRMSSEL